MGPEGLDQEAIEELLSDQPRLVGVSLVPRGKKGEGDPRDTKYLFIIREAVKRSKQEFLDSKKK